MTKPKRPDKLTYEQAFEELEEVVAKLEGGEMPLEESLACFERGLALSARCSELVENAELKLRQLVQDESGETIARDFEA